MGKSSIFSGFHDVNVQFFFFFFQDFASMLVEMLNTAVEVTYSIPFIYLFINISFLSLKFVPKMTQEKLNEDDIKCMMRDYKQNDWRQWHFIHTPFGETRLNMGWSVLPPLLIQESRIQIMDTGFAFWRQILFPFSFWFCHVLNSVFHSTSISCGGNTKTPLGERIEWEWKQKERVPTICQLLHLSTQPFDEAAQGYEANQTPLYLLPQQTGTALRDPKRLLFC